MFDRMLSVVGEAIRKTYETQFLGGQEHKSAKTNSLELLKEMEERIALMIEQIETIAEIKDDQEKNVGKKWLD